MMCIYIQIHEEAEWLSLCSFYTEMFHWDPEYRPEPCRQPDTLTNFFYPSDSGNLDLNDPTEWYLYQPEVTQRAARAICIPFE